MSATTTELSGWIVTVMLSAVAGEGFVDRVVDDLVDQVVEAARPGGADVHAGPLADRLEALEDGDVLCVVTLVATHYTSPDCRGTGDAADG